MLRCAPPHPCLRNTAGRFITGRSARDRFILARHNADTDGTDFPREFAAGFAAHFMRAHGMAGCKIARVNREFTNVAGIWNVSYRF